MKKSSFRLKPGQVCTINHHIYQAKKVELENDNVESVCSECEKVNKVCCIAATKKFPNSCRVTFGYFMYPKLIK